MMAFKASTDREYHDDDSVIIVSAIDEQQARALLAADSDWRNETDDGHEEYAVERFPAGDADAALDTEPCVWAWGVARFDRRYRELGWRTEDGSCCGDCGLYEFGTIPESALDDEYHEVCRECLAERVEEEEGVDDALE